MLLSIQRYVKSDKQPSVCPIFFVLQRYFSTAITVMVVSIVNDAELSWGYTVNGLLGMDDGFTLANSSELSFDKFWCMPYLERYRCRCGRRGRQGQCQPVQVVHLEVLTIGRLRVVAMTHVECVC